MDLLERAKTRLAWANNMGYPAREGARINLVEEDVPALISEIERLHVEKQDLIDALRGVCNAGSPAQVLNIAEAAIKPYQA